MKIAICFSGQIRTGIDTYKNIINFIGDLLPNCDFFMHTWSTESHAPTICYYKEELDSISNKKINKIVSLYNPIKYVMDDFHDEVLKNSYLEGPFNGRFYSWNKSVEYKKEYEELNGFKYDYVIKLRYDTIISDRIKLLSLINQIKGDEFGVENTYIDQYNNMALDDNIFISNSIVSDIAAKWDFYHRNNYNNIHKSYPNDINEHTLLFKYLNENNISVKTYDLQSNGLISIYRAEASRFDPLDQYDKAADVNFLLYWNRDFCYHLNYEEICQLINDFNDDDHFRIDNLRKIKNRNLI